MRDLMELANEVGKGISGATFSADRLYRYALWRIWDREKPAVIFVGLNPSTASEFKDDPTIVRLAGFAKNWGYGGLYAGNLFALVSSDSAAILVESKSASRRAMDPVGEDNNQALEVLKRCPGMILVGWGRHGCYCEARCKAVLGILGEPVYCLGTTEGKQPAHPLYQLRDTKPREYRVDE